MTERPEGLSRIADKLVLAACALLSIWMMTWDEPARVRRAAAWLHTMVAPIEWTNRMVEDLVSLKRDNEELRARIASLELDLSELERGRSRLEKLESRAGFYERTRGRLVPAEVLELVVSRIPIQAKIKSFGEDSLAAWMPVISEDGLVGRVRQVIDKDLALVQLLTEEDSRISVEVARTGATGLLRYDGRRFFIDHVPQGERVAVGDDVISSGLGGTVPRGIAVGTIKRVRSSPSELFQQIEIESAVAFSALRRVYVVTRPGPWYSRGGGLYLEPPDTTQTVADSTEGASP